MTLFLLLDYFGAMFFAISGTLSAADKKLDMFGAAFIGFVTAVGGGTLRDLMIGDHPVGWLKTPIYFYMMAAGVVIAFIFQKYLSQLRRTFFLFDTIGIGLYTIIGLEKSLAFGITPPLAVMMGMITAVFGGIVRDTLINEVPLIFHQELYATACLAGALIYLILFYFTPLPKSAIEMATIATIIVIRILAIKYNLKLPLLTPNGTQSDS
jgi:uncharacterized membrane protein YeiH